MELKAIFAQKWECRIYVLHVEYICVMLYDEICLHIMQTLNGGGV